MKMATGDYFVLGDHDDVFEPDALLNVQEPLIQKKNLI